MPRACPSVSHDGLAACWRACWLVVAQVKGRDVRARRLSARSRKLLAQHARGLGLREPTYSSGHLIAAAPTQVRFPVRSWFGKFGQALRTERQATAEVQRCCRQNPAAAAVRTQPPLLTCALAAQALACARSANHPTTPPSALFLRRACRPQPPRFCGLDPAPSGRSIGARLQLSSQTLSPRGSDIASIRLF